MEFFSIYILKLAFLNSIIPWTFFQVVACISTSYYATVCICSSPSYLRFHFLQFPLPTVNADLEADDPPSDTLSLEWPNATSGCL